MRTSLLDYVERHPNEPNVKEHFQNDGIVSIYDEYRVDDTRSSLRLNDLDIEIIIAFLILIIIGRYILAGSKGALRLAIVYSIIWVILGTQLVHEYFLYGTVIPNVIFWGGIWIIQGFKSKKHIT